MNHWLARAGCQLRGDNDPRNLVFPFYIIPEEQPGELTAASGSA